MSGKQTVLITGGSSGFGLLTTQALLQKGYNVIATVRDPKGRNAEAAAKLQKAAEGASGELLVLDLDVTNDGSVESGIRSAEEKFGAIDVLVNNAGFGAGGFAEAFTADEYKQVFEVNVFGVQRITRAVLPKMRERGSGLVLFISSLMGRITIPFAAPYTATKYALEGLAESYRYELSGTGVDVSIVEPGGYDTGFGSKMTAPKDEARQASYGDLTKIPEQMWGGMMEALSSNDGPDPNDVPKGIIQLIETSAGERPLRLVVDTLMGGAGVAPINELTDTTQAQLLENMGVAQLARIQVKV